MNVSGHDVVGEIGVSRKKERKPVHVAGVGAIQSLEIGQRLRSGRIAWQLAVLIGRVAGGATHRVPDFPIASLYSQEGDESYTAANDEAPDRR
jgi:hypothetical protein